MRIAYPMHPVREEENLNRFTTTKQIEDVMKVLLSSMEEKKSYMAARNNLERNGQKDIKTIEMWNNHVNVTLGRYTEALNVVLVEMFVKGLKNEIKMIEKQAIETITFEDMVKKVSKMLRYNSNKPEADKTPRQDGRTVALVFSIMINEETCKRIVLIGGVTSTRISNQELPVNVHNTITNNSNNVRELQYFKCGNYRHKTIKCNNELTCFTYSRTGHLSRDCNTPKYTICGKYRHSNHIC